MIYIGYITGNVTYCTYSFVWIFRCAVTDVADMRAFGLKDVILSFGDWELFCGFHFLKIFLLNRRSSLERSPAPTPLKFGR